MKRKITFEDFIDWYNSIQSVHPITHDIYERLELKFK